MDQNDLQAVDQMASKLASDSDDNYTKEFDYFIPLGTMCIPADKLNTYGLRKGAYPLDWVAIEFKVLLAAIADGFSKFMDLSNIIQSCDRVYRGTTIGQVTSFVYGNGGIQYAHHNPFDPEKAAQLSRAVGRWQQLEEKCNSGEVKVMFVSMSRAPSVPENAAEQIMKSLEKRFPRGVEKGNIELLFVETVYVQERNGLGFTDVSSKNRIRHIKVEILMSQKKTMFESSQKDKEVWDHILSEYKLSSIMPDTRNEIDVADNNQTTATLSRLQAIEVDTSLLPADFVWNVYTSLHKDLADMPEKEAIKHYLDHGKRVGRRYLSSSSLRTN
jgi:hypothetical protein